MHNHSIPIHLATQRAISILELLQPYCESIHIAGSVRRQKSHVHDIEVVCITNKIVTDLFSTEKKTDPQFDKALARISRCINKGNSNGRYMQVTMMDGINLDVFMPVPEDYWRQFVIRTGSAEWVQIYIATQWLKLGWCGTEHGLRRQSDCEKTMVGEKTKWKLINPDGEKPPVWESEQEFFEWLQVPLISPRERSWTLNIYQ